MSGPGTSPSRKKPPSRIAIAVLPGTPKAMVGMSAPPSLELFAAPGPEHAAHVALAEPPALLGGARALRGVAVGHPLRHRAAHARQ